MAAPTDTPSNGDIWHLTIDDLLAPLPETVRLGGAGPYVINLSASSAPIELPKSIADCRDAHLYQVQRIEDRRVRYRLRLGPFAREDEADAVLKRVRDDYPSALTATADAEDLRALAALRVKLPVQQAPTEKSAERLSVPPVPPPPSQSPPAAPVSVPVLTEAQRLPVRPVPVPKPPQAPTAAPALNVARPPAASPQPAAAMPPPRVPVPRVPVPREAGQSEPAKRMPTLESTQTVRALTHLELQDDQASQWFAIQLALAEEAFDPETLPNLDIFTVYRLYSVAGIDQGRILHALRLGFFTEQIAAGAVASYLAAFYDKPTIKRVSTAERERFAQQSIEPRKDVGATGKQAVIEITNERYIRERRVGQAAAK